MPCLALSFLPWLSFTCCALLLCLALPCLALPCSALPYLLEWVGLDLGWAWVGLVLNWIWLGLAWLGLAWPGLAWLGLAWLGLAWLGLAWLGLAWLGFLRLALTQMTCKNEPVNGCSTSASYNFAPLLPILLCNSTSKLQDQNGRTGQPRRRSHVPGLCPLHVQHSREQGAVRPVEDLPARDGGQRWLQVRIGRLFEAASEAS